MSNTVQGPNRRVHRDPSRVGAIRRDGIRHRDGGGHRDGGSHCDGAIRRDGGGHCDGGYATAEAAVVLPVLLLVLAMAIWVLGCVSAQLRCTDAAGLAARAAARGDAPAAIRLAARPVAPPGAEIVLSTTAEQVEVVVRATVRPFPRALVGPPEVEVSARAVAAREDRVGRP